VSTFIQDDTRQKNKRRGSRGGAENDTSNKQLNDQFPSKGNGERLETTETQKAQRKTHGEKTK